MRTDVASILWSNHGRCKNVLQPATLLNCLLLKIKEQLWLTQRPLPRWPAQCSGADVCITGDIRGTIKYFNSLFRIPRLDECKSELLVTPERSVPPGFMEMENVIRLNKNKRGRINYVIVLVFIISYPKAVWARWRLLRDISSAGKENMDNQNE